MVFNLFISDNFSTALVKKLNVKTITGRKTWIDSSKDEEKPDLGVKKKMDPEQQHRINFFIILHEKFLQFDWLRAVVFQFNLTIPTCENYKPFAGSSINK